MVFECGATESAVEPHTVPVQASTVLVPVARPKAWPKFPESFVIVEIVPLDEVHLAEANVSTVLPLNVPRA